MCTSLSSHSGDRCALPVRPSRFSAGAVLLLGAAVAGLAGAQADNGEGQTPLPSAASVLDRYIQVTGGQAAYERIRNRVVRGSVVMAGVDIKASMTIVSARPNLLYTLMESTSMGRMERGTDGEVVWEKTEARGVLVKEGQERRDMLRDATFDRHVNWRQVYEEVQTVGLETVDGEECLKVQVTPVAGTPQYMYFQRQSGLLTRISVPVQSPQGETVAIHSSLKDYQETDGILLPREVVVDALGNVRRILTLSVEHNVDLPPDRFQPPAEAPDTTQDPGETTPPGNTPE